MHRTVARQFGSSRRRDRADRQLHASGDRYAGSPVATDATEQAATARVGRPLCSSAVVTDAAGRPLAGEKRCFKEVGIEEVSLQVRLADPRNSASLSIVETNDMKFRYCRAGERGGPDSRKETRSSLAEKDRSFDSR